MSRIEPPPCRWRLPDPAHADDHGIAGIGGDLEPGTVLHAYRTGLFPMHVDHGRTLGWWSPDPRGILDLEDLRVSRSLRKSCAKFEVRVDTCFDDVVVACGDPDREGRWITDEIRAAYNRLHDMGWAHSVETFDTSNGEDRLVGGLYGISIGGFFAGESMFHRVSDASKVALVGLVEVLREGGVERLLDVQWTTDHLESLGATEIPQRVYLRRLKDALALPAPPAFA